MKLIWYAFHVADYARDTAHLSMLEHGAYRLLLDQYYLTGGCLPANAEQLHRICRAVAEPEQRALQYVLQQFFKLTDAGWLHERAEAELAQTRELSDKRRQAAASRHSGVKSKVAKAHANADANAGANGVQEDQQLHTQSQSHIPITNVIGLGDNLAQPSKEGKKKRAAKLPADFAPDETCIALARKLGVGQSELVKFRDYHTAKGSTMADWQAAFRTWLHNAKKFTSASSGQAGGGKFDPLAFINGGGIPPQFPGDDDGIIDMPA